MMFNTNKVKNMYRPKYRVGWGKAPPLSVFTFLNMKYWTKSGDILCSGDICCDLSTPQKQIHCDLNYLRYLQFFIFYILAFLPHGWGKMPLGGVLPHMQGRLAPIYRGVLPPPIIFPQTGVITSKHFALLHRWLTRLSARLQWLQCVSNGVTAVLHKASNICMNISYQPQNYHSRVNSRRHCLLIINDWMHSTQFTRMYRTLLCSLFNSK